MTDQGPGDPSQGGGATPPVPPGTSPPGVPPPGMPPGYPPGFAGGVQLPPEVAQRLAQSMSAMQGMVGPMMSFAQTMSRFGTTGYPLAKAAGRVVRGFVLVVVLAVLVPILIPLFGKGGLGGIAIPGEQRVFPDNITLRSVNLTATLASDGTVSVNERASFADGDGGTLPIPPACGTHPERFFGCSRDVVVDGRPVAAPGDSSASLLEIAKPSARVTYRLGGQIILAYTDVAILEMPLIARDPSATYSDRLVAVRGRLTLPGVPGAGSVDARLHTAGTKGQVTLTGSDVRFDLDTSLFLATDLHMAFPPSLVRGPGVTQIPTDGSDIFRSKEHTLDQVDGAVGGGLGTVRKAHSSFRIFFLIAAFAIPAILWALVALGALRRMAARRREPKGIPEYEEAPPSADDPAVVAALIGQGRPDPSAVAGVVLSMAARKQLDVQPLAEGHFSVAVKGGAQPLTEGESVVLNELRIQSALGNGRITGPPIWSSPAGWWRAVRSDAIHRAQFRGLSTRILSQGLVSVAIIFTAIGLSIYFSLANPTIVVILAVLVAIAGQLLALRAGYALTDAGKILRARWLAYGRYLKDKTAMQDQPVGGVVVWGDQLAYGSVLGVAPTAAKDLTPPT